MKLVISLVQNRLDQRRKMSLGQMAFVLEQTLQFVAISQNHGVRIEGEHRDDYSNVNWFNVS
jgi:hypothetical protein